MKKILITAAGTATTWHFCQIINEYFKDKYEIHLTDINEEYLVPSTIYCHKFHKVPPIFADNYEEKIYEIIRDEKIDIIIPLIDFDLSTFSKDNQNLKKLNCYTTAPVKKTVETLSNKKTMHNFLSENGILTPKVFNEKEIIYEDLYILKPVTGFGSTGVKKVQGKEIKNSSFNFNNYIIQECCDDHEEITAEIYNGKTISIFQRKRVATKAGVCTKMVPVYYEEIEQAIKKLVNIIECPEAFCIQFMKTKDNHWALIDCNLRIGAGTALSTKIGFQLVRALLTSLLNENVPEDLFKIDKSIKSVLRVYEEIVIK